MIDYHEWLHELQIGHPLLERITESMELDCIAGVLLKDDSGGLKIRCW